MEECLSWGHQPIDNGRCEAEHPPVCSGTGQLWLSWYSFQDIEEVSPDSTHPCLSCLVLSRHKEIFMQPFGIFASWITLPFRIFLGFLETSSSSKSSLSSTPKDASIWCQEFLFLHHVLKHASRCAYPGSVRVTLLVSFLKGCS